MKNFKYVLLSIILFIICPKVKADLCDDKDKINYQSLAKNISGTYEYVPESNTFNIIFTNVDSTLYFKELNTGGIYGYTGNEMVLFNFIPGNSYKFGVYTSNYECRNDKMYTIYLTLPFYNPYYQDSLCEGIENYKYCSKFISKFITYEEFKNNIEQYKKSSEKENDANEEVTYSIFDYIILFYVEYYHIILPLIIVICLFIRCRYNKKQDLF